MATVEQHYEDLLARHYSWLWGGIEAKVQDNEALFSSLGITPSLSGRCVDLGCGSGFQSIPLAQAGFFVTAIDLSQVLLDELRANAGGLNVRPVRADILDMHDHCPEPVELVVCMGDTLTHLDGELAVDKLFRSVCQSLEKGGKFVITYRDLTFELTDLDRFIPVRSDDETIFTCYLEYQEKTVTVHDLVHVRTDNGWQLNKSSYSKLRLAVENVVERLECSGLTIVHNEVKQGLVTLVAEKE